MKRTLIGQGAECKVYDIGDGICYKRYWTKENAKLAYNNATIAEEAGIGPKVYKLGKHGYTTEIVETCEFICKRCDEIPEDCSSLCSYFIDKIGREKYYEMTDIVEEIFGEMATTDFHNDNIGIKNGKPVIIDFGIASGLNWGINGEILA